MRYIRSNVSIIILLVNIGLILISNSVINLTTFENTHSSGISRKMDRAYNESFPDPLQTFNESNSLNKMKIPIQNSNPTFSIQQQNVTLILNQSDEKNPDLISFVNNIWNSTLGSDALALEYSSSFMNGLIISNSSIQEYFESDQEVIDELENVNNSLFVRIGNNGYIDGYNDELDDSVSEGISAGWQIEFPVTEDYDLINVSFKWRFDALDDAFDNKVKLSPGFYNDDTIDFQEIRARIINPLDSDKSFWIEHPTTDENPNGSIYYRFGPDVIGDEVWYTYNYSFYAAKLEMSTYILELGAYLNTREDRLEFFDIWLDDIIIKGIKEQVDTLPPQPISTGLNETLNTSRFEFWANCREGIWSSSIENVTVYYNQSNILGSSSRNASMNLEDDRIDLAGYNQTYWNFFTDFDFGDNVTFQFKVFDSDNNSYYTPIQEKPIGDFLPPIINSTTNTSDSRFVQKLGNGTVMISIQVYDWGNATQFVILNYEIEEGTNDSLIMFDNGTHYTTTITVDYREKLDFYFFLNDSIGNTNQDQRSFSIESDIDKIEPNITDFVIYLDSKKEGKAYINVSATDLFGEIDRVYLEVTDLTSLNSTDLILTYDNTSEVYKLNQGLDLNYGNNYSLTVSVRDQAGLEHQETYYYVMEDKIKPEIPTIEMKYQVPGSLKITVYTNDDGSGINVSSFSLERKTDGEWVEINSFNFEYNNDNSYYSLIILTNWLGNEQLLLRVRTQDNAGNEAIIETTYSTRIFFATTIGLLLTEIIAVIVIVGIFSAIRLAQRQQLKIRRRARFDVALSRSERLSYLGEEAMFGFLSAFGQQEGVSSILMWEPRKIGNFYQYLKELADKANNHVSFVMQTKPADIVTFIDFYIEEIGCSAITLAYPVSTLPQRWLSTITLDQVPMGGGQGVLLLMFLMREKWGEISNDFQEEIADGMVELKDLILAGEDKETILKKVREFRLFISGTVEVLDEIDTEVDEMADEIMGDFDTDLLDTDSDTESQEESSPDDVTDDDSDAIMGDFDKEFLDTDSDTESQEESSPDEDEENEY